LRAITNSQRRPGERRDEVLGDAVRQIVLLGIGAHAREGQDRDRRLVGDRRGRPLRLVAFLGRALEHLP
jgi:hypothetical protein